MDGGLLATWCWLLFFSFGHLWNRRRAAGRVAVVMAAGYLMIGVGFGLMIWRGGRWVPGLTDS